MSSSTWRRWSTVQSTNGFSKRWPHSWSSHIRPPRSRGWTQPPQYAAYSSMYSTVRASVALPERSSRGMIMSASTLADFHSSSLKNFGT